MVNSLDAVDIGEKVLVGVQVECGRAEVNNREIQEKGQNDDATNRQSNTHRGWHEDAHWGGSS